MSTKQTVIYTLMILFTGVLFYTMGLWFKTSTELATKERHLEVLDTRLSQVKMQIDDQKAGIKQVEMALEIELRNAAVRRKKMQGDPKLRDDKTDIAEDGENLYRERLRYAAMEPELAKQWPEIDKAWKNVYQTWKARNDEILKLRLEKREEVKKAEKAVVEAKVERDNAVSAKLAEDRKVQGEKKRMIDELGTIITQNDELVEKIAISTRELRKKAEIAPQGRIINVAEDLRLITVDQGYPQGIRKDMLFDIYSSSHAQPVKKGVVKITYVGAESS